MTNPYVAHGTSLRAAVTSIDRAPDARVVRESKRVAYVRAMDRSWSRLENGRKRSIPPQQ